MSQNIPLLNLKLQHEPIQKEINEIAVKVFSSGQFILGPENKAFEEEFAKAMDTKYSATCASGAAAIQIALIACGVGPGDEVITTPFTFIATTSSISLTGAKFVFADIDPKTCCIDPKSVESKITKKTKAILPVHLYGYPADMTSLMEIAEKHNIKVIEDCAQSHLAKHRGRTTGSIGHMGAFSFYPTKNLGACGDGGAITTNDEELLSRALSIRHCGRSAGKAYEHCYEGSTLRMDEIQSAILRIKLRRLAEWTNMRQKVADMYGERLKGAPVELPPTGEEGTTQSFYTYTIKAPKRDELGQFLKERNIGTAIHYPIPLYKQPVYAKLGINPKDFPNTEKAAMEVISIPMFPELTKEQVETVCNAIREFYRK
jgi:UDP-N-acetyl-3-dehydro-alpha-D-glucosamine 3-aminotranferase